MATSEVQSIKRDCGLPKRNIKQKNYGNIGVALFLCFFKRSLAVAPL